MSKLGKRRQRLIPISLWMVSREERVRGRCSRCATKRTIRLVEPLAQAVMSRS